MDMDINLQMGRIFRQYREGHGLSQEEFAELCGISRAYYGRLELGRHSVTLTLCKKIADMLGVHMADLFQDLP